MFNILVPLTSIPKEKNIFAFDIETKGLLNEFVMGSIYGIHSKFRKDRNQIITTITDKIFWNQEEFAEYIVNNEQLYDNSYLCATNLGFDLLGLFGETDFLPKINLIIRGSNIILATIKHPKRHSSIRFLDSNNFSKFSVKQMGNLLGLPKLPQPICFKKAPSDETEAKELENYNKRDTRITYEYIKFLQKGFSDLGANMKFTIASTSMDLFKRKYLKQILKQNPDTLPILFKAYYGARTEILKRGYIENLKYYDVNSLYPFCMLREYPNPNYEFYTEKGNMNLLKDSKNEGVMKVTVKIDNLDLPYLPYRHFDIKDVEQKGDYKLIFPLGIFTGYYTFFELRKAIQLGYKILDFGEAVYYTKTFKPFEEYVKTLYSLRMKYKNEKSIIEIVCKIAMNSLYGKFAQKLEDKESIFHLNSLEYEKIKEYTESSKYHSIIRGDYIYVKNKFNSYIPSFVIPIFSIYTTAYARDVLYNKIKEVGVENVYYYDTDSIITDKILDTSQNLGDLKLEYFIRDGVLVAPKMYAFVTDTQEIVKVKGASNLKNYIDFEKILEEKKYYYEKFVKFKEANSRNLKYNQILLVEKNFTMEDNKRIWESSFNPELLQDSKAISIFE